MSVYLQDEPISWRFLSYYEICFKALSSQDDTYEWVSVYGGQKEIENATSWIIKDPVGATLGFGKIRFGDPKEIHRDRLTRLVHYACRAEAGGVWFLRPDCGDLDCLPKVEEDQLIPATVLEMGPVMYIPLALLSRTMLPWWEECIKRHEEKARQEALLNKLYSVIMYRGRIKY